MWDAATLFNVLMRLVHVLTAVVLMGGTAYVRFVLLPAAADLPEAEHQALRERLLTRWRSIVWRGILLLLITGFYNYLEVTAPAHRGQGVYHMLMGIKILLALGVFFLASVLTGRSPRFERLRQEARCWLTVLLVLAGIVVGIGSLLKVAVLPTPPVAPEPQPTSFHRAAPPSILS